MSEPGPAKWAIDITHILNAALGPNHFPIKVQLIAKEFSKQRYPDDPITDMIGDNLPGFDGALRRSKNKKGWGVFYNDQVSSPGRINFTLAHEFGHYLLHRRTYPEGIKCGTQDMIRWDTEYALIEQQANLFAATLLMPLDDFRKQIDARGAVDFDVIGECARRYEVSTTAATLRWLSYTEKRALLVVSRDNFILWARSSDKAFRTGAFFRTKGQPVEVPAGSLVARGVTNEENTMLHGPGIWFDEETIEITLFADKYDFALSLLILPDDREWRPTDSL